MIHHDRQMQEVRIRAQLAEELEPVHPRQPDVEQDYQIVEREVTRPQRLERVDAVGRIGDSGHQLGRAEEALDVESVELIVFNV